MSASKHEQMVLEWLKSQEKKDEKAIEESEKKVKEYNTKSMMQMSMKSILGCHVCLSIFHEVYRRTRARFLVHPLRVTVYSLDRQYHSGWSTF